MKKLDPCLIAVIAVGLLASVHSRAETRVANAAKIGAQAAQRRAVLGGRGAQPRGASRFGSGDTGRPDNVGREKTGTALVRSWRSHHGGPERFVTLGPQNGV